MAEDPKQTPITPSQFPVVDTGTKPSGVTLTGGETLKGIPDVDLSTEIKPFVHIEDQPDNQIPLEGPLSMERVLDINRAPSSLLDQTQKEPEKPVKTLDNVISFEEAAKKIRSAKSILPPIPAKRDSTYWLSVLKVKSQKWLDKLRKKKEKEERLAA